MKRFKSSRQCQRFVSIHGPIVNPAEAAEDAVPLTEHLLKVAPERAGAHDPEHAFDEHTVAATRRATRAFITDDVRRYPLSLLVAKDQAIQNSHDCLQKDSLESDLLSLGNPKKPHLLGDNRRYFALS